MTDLLGCQLNDNPERTTRDFYDAVEAFINEDVVSPIKQARYHMALLSRMRHEQLDLRPKSFCQAASQSKDHAAVLDRLEARGIDPDSPLSCGTA